MHKVYGSSELDSVVYMPQADGTAHVWIRQNQASEETGEETNYSADEVFCVVTAGTVSEKEIRADVAWWFANITKDGMNADCLQVEAVRAAKRAEISKICNTTICNGVDVTLTDGSVKHFSLTDEDQLNLFGKQSQLVNGSQQVEYHADGEPCILFSAADAQLIITAAMAYKTFHTTYANSMFQWIKALKKASTLSAITYGADIPEKYQSEVLKAILAGA